ncbi:MAG: hypothetical protein L0Z53_01505, partial [Acidobacteriales bacterium]|nr:hypothetical protein [Terriglobales bacterium]
MNCARGFWVAALLLAALPLFGQKGGAQISPEETEALAAIEKLMVKIHQGGNNPSQDDLRIRRETGLDMAKQGQEFLQNYPASKKAEDANALINIGLYEAALAGSAGAAEQLEKRTAAMLKDPQVPETLKLHTFAVNFIAQWARQNEKRALVQGSDEFQKAYREAFFAAADVL